MVEAEKTQVTRECVLHTAFSGAVGKATDTRSQRKNKQLAFKRMAESKEFKAWHKIECARRLGNLQEVEDIVNQQMADKNLKIELLGY